MADWGRGETLRKNGLQQRLLLLSFVNLLLVALLGLLLRVFPFLSSFPLSYKNLLHGHSHFAFGGWLMPVLLSMVMKHFPALRETVPYRHWRNITLLVLLSAYGMLVSFPLQGYAAISISFSMGSIVATVYLALVVWKAAERMASSTSLPFLKWGLLYACLSTVGPFATGPLVALGKGGSPLYFDAIYFYLHFQYNGFFTFAVLALLYRLLEKKGFAGYGKKAFLLFNAACLPAYALSVLWNEPSVVFHFIGAGAGLLQLTGLFYLWKDVSAAGVTKKAGLLRLSLAAFVLKNGLQFFSAFPAVALLAYQQRNFVIAYLHLVLLGFVSLAVFALAVKRNFSGRLGAGLFLFSFLTTEILLVLNASAGILHFDVPYYLQLLLICSLFFPVGVIFLLRSLMNKKDLQPKRKFPDFSPSHLLSSFRGKTGSYRMGKSYDRRAG